jgi:hypothetical protein
MAAKLLKPFRFGKDVCAFVTTRHSGNLSLFIGDSAKKVLNNRKRIARALHIPYNRLISAQQVHKDRIVIIKRLPISLRSTDAMITDLPGICLMLTTADCVPLLFYDPNKRVIAGAHAGWRGTILKIAQKTARTMHKKFGSRLKDILVGFGPSIRPCCYEVGPEVSRKFGKSGRIHIDLRRENKDQLVKIGIPSKNIYICRSCTMCNCDEYFSARASKSGTGRFGTGIMLIKSAKP